MISKVLIFVLAISIFFYCYYIDSVLTSLCNLDGQKFVWTIGQNISHKIECDFDIISVDFSPKLPNGISLTSKFEINGITEQVQPETIYKAIINSKVDKDFTITIISERIRNLAIGVPSVYHSSYHYEYNWNDPKQENWDSINLGNDISMTSQTRYIRGTFTIDNGNLVNGNSRVKFTITYNCGILLYMNGKLFYKKNIFSDEIGTLNYADKTTRFENQVITMSGYYLRDGVNYIGIELHKHNSQESVEFSIASIKTFFDTEWASEMDYDKTSNQQTNIKTKVNGIDVALDNAKNMFDFIVPSFYSLENLKCLPTKCPDETNLTYIFPQHQAKAVSYIITYVTSETVKFSPKHVKMYGSFDSESDIWYEIADITTTSKTTVDSTDTEKNKIVSHFYKLTPSYEMIRFNIMSINQCDSCNIKISELRLQFHAGSNSYKCAADTSKSLPISYMGTRGNYIACGDGKVGYTYYECEYQSSTFKWVYHTDECKDYIERIKYNENNELLFIIGKESVYTISKGNFDSVSWENTNENIQLDEKTGKIIGLFDSKIEMNILLKFQINSLNKEIEETIHISTYDPLIFDYNQKEFYFHTNEEYILNPTVVVRDLKELKCNNNEKCEFIELNVNDGSLKFNPKSEMKSTKYDIILIDIHTLVYKFEFEISVYDKYTSKIEYEYPHLIFYYKNSMKFSKPIIDGSVDEFSISPELPSGLSINRYNGEISGIVLSDKVNNPYTISVNKNENEKSIKVTISVKKYCLNDVDGFENVEENMKSILPCNNNNNNNIGYKYKECSYNSKTDEMEWSDVNEDNCILSSNDYLSNSKWYINEKYEFNWNNPGEKSSSNSNLNWNEIDLRNEISMSNKRTKYLRNIFIMNDKMSKSRLEMKISYNCGIILYLNGKIFYRRNIDEDGNLDYASRNNEMIDQTITTSIHYLHNGLNTFGVELHKLPNQNLIKFQISSLIPINSEEWQKVYICKETKELDIYQNGVKIDDSTNVCNSYDANGYTKFTSLNFKCENGEFDKINLIFESRDLSANTFNYFNWMKSVEAYFPKDIKYYAKYEKYSDENHWIYFNTSSLFYYRLMGSYEQYRIEVSSTTSACSGSTWHMEWLEFQINYHNANDLYMCNEDMNLKLPKSFIGKEIETIPCGDDKIGYEYYKCEEEELKWVYHTDECKDYIERIKYNENNELLFIIGKESVYTISEGNFDSVSWENTNENIQLDEKTGKIIGLFDSKIEMNILLKFQINSLNKEIEETIHIITDYSYCDEKDGYFKTKFNSNSSKPCENNMIGNMYRYCGGDISNPSFIGEDYKEECTAVEYETNHFVFNINKAVDIKPISKGVISGFTFTGKGELPKNLEIYEDGVINGTVINLTTKAVEYIVNVAHSQYPNQNIIIKLEIEVLNNYIKYSKSLYTWILYSYNETEIPQSSNAIIDFDVNPALPLGLSINKTTGVISGIVNKEYTSQQYTITGKVSNLLSITTELNINSIKSYCEETDEYPKTEYNSNVTVSCGKNGFGYRTRECKGDIVNPNWLEPYIYCQYVEYKSNYQILINEKVKINPYISGDVTDELSFTLINKDKEWLKIDSNTGLIYGIVNNITPFDCEVLVKGKKYGSITFQIHIDIINVQFYYNPNKFDYFVYIYIITPPPVTNKLFDYYAIDSALPNGLSFNSKTGQIYGTTSEEFSNKFIITGVSELNYTTSLSINITTVYCETIGNWSRTAYYQIQSLPCPKQLNLTGTMYKRCQGTIENPVWGETNINDCKKYIKPVPNIFDTPKYDDLNNIIELESENVNNVIPIIIPTEKTNSEFVNDMKDSSSSIINIKDIYSVDTNQINKRTEEDESKNFDIAINNKIIQDKSKIIVSPSREEFSSITLFKNTQESRVSNLNIIINSRMKSRRRGLNEMNEKDDNNNYNNLVFNVGKCGIFGSINNSVISNITIYIKDLTVLNCFEYGGIFANQIRNSIIYNVTIHIQDIPIIVDLSNSTVFGFLSGLIENTTIENCRVVGSKVSILPVQHNDDNIITSTLIGESIDSNILFSYVDIDEMRIVNNMNGSNEVSSFIFGGLTGKFITTNENNYMINSSFVLIRNSLLISQLYNNTNMVIILGGLIGEETSNYNNCTIKIYSCWNKIVSFGFSYEGKENSKFGGFIGNRDDNSTSEISITFSYVRILMANQLVGNNFDIGVFFGFEEDENIEIYGNYGYVQKPFATKYENEIYLTEYIQNIKESKMLIDKVEDNDNILFGDGIKVNKCKTNICDDELEKIGYKKSPYLNIYTNIAPAETEKGLDDLFKEYTRKRIILSPYSKIPVLRIENIVMKEDKSNSYCANKCSEHGKCYGNICLCDPYYTCITCSEHSCRYGESLGGFVGECSNQGECDRLTGNCKCYPGYEGSACQRTKCHNNCNGHGQCVSDYNNKKVSKCECDEEYEGYDCSYRKCPKGLTTSSDCEESPYHTEIITIIDRRTDAGDVDKDFIYIYYKDPNEKDWFTIAFNYNDKNSWMKALTSLPCGVISIEEIEIEDDVDLETIIIRIPYTQHQTGRQFPMKVIGKEEIQNLDKYNIPHFHGLVDRDDLLDTKIDQVVVSYSSETPSVGLECSGNGICNRKSGLCECFSGYYGISCSIDAEIV